MSKWRPSKKDCIYVIPDVHGALSCLELICDRILPLRKSDGGRDRLIFLGDYIDRHVDSHRVVDFLIDLEKQYKDQVVFILGNHELMLLESLNIVPNKTMTLQHMMSTYQMWMKNGGYATIAGYLHRIGKESGWDTLPRSRVLDIIPKEHIEFFTKSLVPYYELDEYIFVHGGIDPTSDPRKQDREFLAWDRSLLKFVQYCIDRAEPLPWDKTVICGHSVGADKKPVVQDNYMMLDCGSPQQLLVMEARSREAFMAYPDKNRLVKFKLEKTIKKVGLVRRSS